MILDKLEIITAFRTAFFGAEIVDVITTGERVAIRDGVFEASPGIYTRPDDPAERPIGTINNTQLIEQNFNKTGLTYFISEMFLPVLEIPTASYVAMLSGIMQYNVWAPSNDGNKMDINLLYNYVKYIQQIFDPQLDNLYVNQTGVNMVTDSVGVAPPLKDGMWNLVPISINFRAYIS